MPETDAQDIVTVKRHVDAVMAYADHAGDTLLAALLAEVLYLLDQPSPPATASLT